MVQQYKFTSLSVCNHGESSLYYSPADVKHEYCHDFDLRKPLEKHFISGQHIDCVSILDSPNLAALRDRCATFLAQFPRYYHTFITRNLLMQVVNFAL